MDTPLPSASGHQALLSSGLPAILLASILALTLLHPDPLLGQRGGWGRITGRFAAALSQLERQEQPTAGVRVGYEDDGGIWALGGQGTIPVGRRGTLQSTAMLFFLKGRTAWQVTLDSPLRFRWGHGFYTGPGLVVGNRRDPPEGLKASVEVATNLFLGFEPRLATLPFLPFVEGRWTFLRRFTPFRVDLGVNFPLGAPRPARESGRGRR